MIVFSPADPFPLVDLGAHSPVEMRTHAAAVDRWFGLRTSEVEHSLVVKGCRLRAPHACGEEQELWFGLDVQSLLTPYVELRALLERVKPWPGQTVVDLGAAYGRMAFVLNRHFPGVRFVGYEYVGERIEEGRRCLANFVPKNMSLGLRLIHADLASKGLRLEEADTYFIYDFGTLRAIEKILYDLRRISRHRPITVVGRGRHCRYLIESRHPWLVPALASGTEAAFTIYRATEGEARVTRELQENS